MSKTFRLGLFILATLVIFSGAIFWIGSKQLLFNSTYRLSTEFKDVGGLVNGAQVRVGGIEEGTVVGIELPRRVNDKVRVTMALRHETRDVLRQDSVASIRQEGLVGDQYVEISFGSESAARVKNGDTIPSEPPLQLSDLIKKTDAILDSAQGAVQNVGDTADNLKNITAKINQGTGTIGALVNDRSVYEHANAAVGSLQEDTEALKHNFLLRGFFKSRGYDDSADLKKNEISALPAKAPSKEFDYETNRIFDKPDNAKLTKQKLLNEAGNFLQANRFGLAVVADYTGMKGDSDKDRQLSEARAMVVRAYLVKNFRLDDTRIKTLGLGKTHSEDAAGKVEILIYQ